jgi:hypothetical protein
MASREEKELAARAGVPVPPSRTTQKADDVIEVGESMPSVGVDPDIHAGYCTCGRPARVDQEYCGICVPSTRPPDGSRWVKGKFADALVKTDLLAMYQRSLMDSNYVSIREYAALIDARLSELLGRLPESLKSHHWSDAAAAWGQMKQAEALGDSTEVQKCRLRIEGLFIQGEKDEETWAGIMAAMELRRKLADSEAKNAEKLQHMLSSAQVLELVSELGAIIKTEIVDPRVRERIAIKIREVVEGNNNTRYAA